MHHDVRAAVAAESAVGFAVDDLVVKHGAFGAHAADDAYGFNETALQKKFYITLPHQRSSEKSFSDDLSFYPALK